MKIQGNEIKPGMIIEFKNDHWTVLKAQHVKPGKGGAFNQVELKSITKGTKLNQRFRSSENIEDPFLKKRILIIYILMTQYVFLWILITLNKYLLKKIF